MEYNFENMEQTNYHGHGLSHQLQNMHHQQNQNQNQNQNQVHQQMQMQRPQQLQLSQDQQPSSQHPMQQMQPPQHPMQQQQPLGHPMQQQQQPTSAQPPQTGFAPRRQYDIPGSSAAAGLTNGNVEGSITRTQRSSKVKKERSSTGQPPQSQSQPQEQAEQQPIQLQLSEVDGGASSTDEAIAFVSETDANGLAMKTPVSILQEILSRRGITPGYELVQIEGAIHEPTFRFRVSFKDKDTPFTAMGAGRSKKEAKHAAARALIDKLMGTQLAEATNSAAAAAVTDPTAPGSGGDCPNAAIGDASDKIVGNPIGLLQELCMQRRWPPPSYDTVTQMGLPHERLFTIACTILQNREIGKGKSKKIAKRLAAHKMWSHLQETPIDAAKIPDVCNELEGDKTCLKNASVDHPKLLTDIAAENQFEVTYVDIEEKTFTGQFQCLVQLSTLPVGVCHGTGPTSRDAQRHAAQNALEYLKIMTKK
ncbi:interferon-inducible double-stranded RNA-dependent protein kinase activator A homolog isoform X4 [Drosophila guanche]|uniref:Blast:RISC-loading complex subunit tarbp2 n=1 Tax=Drosophila guanche TaxID=7266 RepID=A0A3B0KPK6_DROGU|nr:interferon-inducible double-stranded RNA-dependent protein kinase activator A homolog isoform X4 [Drosophila guanche]SPP85778.1 blast:RISC-loading complex subunit tarbp2 [Drosophila guanche]